MDLVFRGHGFGDVVDSNLLFCAVFLPLSIIHFAMLSIANLAINLAVIVVCSHLSY